MKILTVLESGEMRELTLTGVLVVTDGKALDRITDEAGVDYYFTKTGLYDGTGTGDCGSGVGEHLWRRLTDGNVED